MLASTGGVYGHRPEPIDEETPTRLTGPYFRSKRISELLLEDYAEILTGVALRFFFIYGAGGGETLVPRLSASILAGEEIRIEGDPGMRMNPIYVADAARAVERALELESPAVVNVAGHEVVAIGELVRLLAEALGREAILEHHGESPGDMVADTTRMREVLGAEAETTLATGLAAVTSALGEAAATESDGKPRES